MIGEKFRTWQGGLAAAVLLAWAPAGAALAQDMPGMGTVCPADAQAAALPAELSGWTRRVPLAAGRDAASAARLVPGTAIEGRLSPTPEVRYALRPEKPGGSVSFGGIFAFTVAETGRYRVALGSAAWIDLIRVGEAAGSGTPGRGLASIAHGHGPDCSGIRKMVDFALEPGDYLVQIAANANEKMPLLVARLP
ncbi:MAG: hypothetical protein K0R64_2867 [Novosphingobium lindaniclasticum]|uniref:homogentisate 1,2-dioxygenase n=1 Tax=Novosphingobium lindaniclasticum TaxID=1329895 RepID=UPI00240A5C8D|nr:homogentisate 1,2-dioxygenase [Novosphingobium lindaniclasticum]MDF2639883.1 hypothetical protein [Novosphingobium lindaniclasticum]